MKKYFLIICLFLSGCATVVVPPKPPSENWVLQGKIGLQSPEASGSASVYWQQQGNVYHIRLFGPLGMGAVMINGNPKQVLLTTHDGKTHEATSAEQLLKENMGWQLPVSNMRYWVRAQASPHAPAEEHYDAAHHLMALKQQGWDIQYFSYKNQQPALMQFTHDKIKVRMVIDTFDYS